MPSDALAPRSSRTQAAEQSRSKILAAATALIAERGFSGFRVVDIAGRASVSPGLVIYYFGTLEALLTEALMTSETAFYDTLRRVTGEDADPHEKLVFIVRAVLGQELSARQARILWLETWAQASNHREVADARARQDRRWRQLFADIATAAGLSGEAAQSFAAVFASLLDGLCVQVALDDPEVTSSRAVELAVEVVGRYFTSRRPEGLPSQDS